VTTEQDIPRLEIEDSSDTYTRLVAEPLARGFGTTVGNALRRTPLGRKAFLGASRLAEMVGVFPKGSTHVVRLLDRTADAYIAGGRTGIFTPLYCFLARKPL